MWKPHQSPERYGFSKPTTAAATQTEYKQYISISIKKPTIRIMGRDYPLTATAYKRLIIGICIGQDSCRIEIAIADNKGHEVCFAISTWKLLLQQESQILRRFRFDAPLVYQDPIAD